MLDVNYTHTKSMAQYPYVYSVSTGRVIQYIDTSFTDRLVDQPDNIFNLSLGFDYRGFSVPAAMVYQWEFIGDYRQVKPHSRST
ncbi:MAG: hypothetical protein M1469_01040 [Bacteroidetes bacterium]|nr:hypothetical protein [Bacteroidota bacterium]